MGRRMDSKVDGQGSGQVDGLESGWMNGRLITCMYV